MTRKKSKITEEIVEIEEQVLEDQPENDHVLVADPVPDPSVTTPKQPNRVLAILLLGTPKLFPEDCNEDLQVLLKEGIAADFGAAGWARGHRWRSFVRKG